MREPMVEFVTVPASDSLEEWLALGLVLAAIVVSSWLISRLWLRPTAAATPTQRSSANRTAARSPRGPRIAFETGGDTAPVHAPKRAVSAPTPVRALTTQSDSAAPVAKAHVAIVVRFGAIEGDKGALGLGRGPLAERLTARMADLLGAPDPGPWRLGPLGRSSAGVVRTITGQIEGTELALNRADDFHASPTTVDRLGWTSLPRLPLASVEAYLPLIALAALDDATGIPDGNRAALPELVESVGLLRAKSRRYPDQPLSLALAHTEAWGRWHLARARKDAGSMARARSDYLVLIEGWPGSEHPIARAQAAANLASLMVDIQTAAPEHLAAEAARQALDAIASAQTLAGELQTARGAGFIMGLAGLEAQSRLITAHRLASAQPKDARGQAAIAFYAANAWRRHLRKARAAPEQWSRAHAVTAQALAHHAQLSGRPRDLGRASRALARIEAATPQAASGDTALALGKVLARLDDLEASGMHLAEAARALKNAVTRYALAGRDDDRCAALGLLGAVLRRLGQDGRDATILEEAADALRCVLDECADGADRTHAATRFELGQVLHLLGRLRRDATLLHEAKTLLHEAVRGLVKEAGQGGDPALIHRARAARADCLAGLVELDAGGAGIALLAYQEAISPWPVAVATDERAMVIVRMARLTQSTATSITTVETSQGAAAKLYGEAVRSLEGAGHAALAVRIKAEARAVLPAGKTAKSLAETAI